MRQSTSFRFMRSVTGQFLFVLALMTLLVLGGQVVKASPLSTTATSAHGGVFTFGKTNGHGGIHRTPWRASRTVARRKGLFGWLMPRQTPQTRAAHYRAAHRPNLHGRSGRKVTLWHRLRG